MPIPVITTPAPYPGVSGSPFGAAGSIVLPGTSGAVAALPLGWQFITATTNVQAIQNTSGSTSLVLVPTGSAGIVYADGTNTEVKNTNTTAETVTYLPLLGL